jgi:hypothetical protein
MTPAKRVKPVAHGFLVSDPVGRFIDELVVWAADGELIFLILRVE